MVEGRAVRKEELMVGERVSKRQTDRDKEETERQRQRMGKEGRDILKE